MSHYRTALPQLGHELFLTDGGLETTLVFLDRMELPCFAAFDLLRRPEGVQRLWDYYRSYADLARRWGVGLILESPTWRANPDWGQRLGCDARKLAELNQASVALMAQVRSEFESAGGRAVVSGCVGPRGDGYVLQQAMSVDEAAAYHSEQVAALADSPADLVTAATMTSSAEAAGVARATARFNIPVVLSFTVETDGRLPSGETLRSAIETVDELTAGAPAYYMVNCAHPEHFGP
ncbi:MAG TPA: homocysteine S-methyltransferase family protein, partial [Gemmatales bacterium]|nr:homocysteine S-methyltransferase family protein [Gemmatales bacterium]